MSELLEQREDVSAERNLDQEAVADLANAHRELIFLELFYRRRQLLNDPALKRLTIGAGAPAQEQTIRGDQKDPFNGVAIFNPTAATLSVGFQAGTGLLAPLTVPPFSYVCVPERFVNLSIALLSAVDQQQTYATSVTILRLRVPPFPSAGAYGNPEVAPALAAANPGATITVGVAGVANIVAANPNRRQLIITNQGATGWATFALGSGIPALNAGVPLAPGGGAGSQFQTTEYDGPVSAIAAVNGTVLSIAEV